MLLRNLLLAFLVCLSPLFADEPLKFATWNLRYANAKDSIEGNGWNKRIQPIANAIRSKDLDVVNLQEMDEVDSIPMVAMLLAELPDYEAVTCGDSLCQEFNPILYKKKRMRLLNHGIFWFSPNPNFSGKAWDAMYSRYCTWAEFEVHGRIFFVFNAHWDHKGSAARRESAAMTPQMVEDISKGKPSIFAGDLNCQRKYDCFQLLKKNFWNDAREKSKFVYLQDSSFNRFSDGIGKKSVDHVFVTNDFFVDHFSITKEIYFDGEKWRNASDHNPVMVKMFFVP